MSFNIWQAKGQLAGLTGKSNPSVIYEGNPQILAGPNVFKMWCGATNNGAGVFYYESADGITGWTAHPSNPIVASPSGAGFPTVYHIGSTYYLYTGFTAINVQTSSDGITFGSTTAIIALGTAGQWDDTHVAQLNIVPGTPGYGTNTGETYYGYYEGITGSGSAEGLVTATNPAGPWTKSGSNPFFLGTAPATFQKVGSTYYMWAPHGGLNFQLNTKGMGGLNRWSSSNPNGPWTLLLANGNTDPTHATSNAVNVIYPSTRADIDLTGTNINTAGASIGDPSMLSALGNLYIYWTRTTTGGTQSGINMAVATSVTPTQQVSGYEGMIDAPIPGYDFNMTVLGTDSFQRADANPIGGNWTTTPTLNNSQIVSNLVETSVLNTNGDSYYNAVSFPNDHWSRITVTKDIHNAAVGLDVRLTAPSASLNLYRLIVNATAGSSMPNAACVAQLVRFISGASTVIGQFTTFTLSVGDTMMVTASGSNVMVYYNGTPMIIATDANNTSGTAGFAIYSGTTALTDAQISAWNGGGFQAVPGSSGGNAIIGIGAIDNRWCSKMLP